MTYEAKTINLVKKFNTRSFDQQTHKKTSFRADLQTVIWTTSAWFARHGTFSPMSGY